MAAGLSVTPLSASGFGGLLEGVELSALLDSPSQLRRAWFQARGLLLLRLRGEALTPAQMVALTSLFGSVEQEMDSSKRDREVAPDDPKARGIMRIGNTRGADGKPNALLAVTPMLDTTREDPLQYDKERRVPVWHTDQTYRKNPPVGSILYCVQAPEDGRGATIFTDATAAFAALPENEKDSLRSLECVCSLTHHDAKVRLRDPGYPACFDDESRLANPPRRVPMVLRHPITGRESLYGMNASTFAIVPADVPTSKRFSQAEIDTFELQGVEDPSVSEIWRNKLLPFVTSREFTLAINWKPGDIALWDNRATMHAATGFDHEGCIREMWRTTIEFDHPDADAAA